MDTETSYPFFVDRANKEITYSYLDVDEKMHPVVRLFTHFSGEQNDRCDTSYIDLAEYIATGHPDGLRRLMEVIGMYIESDVEQQSMSIFVEALR